MNLNLAFDSRKDEDSDEKDEDSYEKEEE